MKTKDSWERLKGKTYPETLEQQQKFLETDETVLAYQERRQHMASDPYRPIYHMSSLSNMGDANGLCHWQNRYTLKCQSCIDPKHSFLEEKGVVYLVLFTKRSGDRPKRLPGFPCL